MAVTEKQTVDVAAVLSAIAGGENVTVTFALKEGINGDKSLLRYS